MTLPFRRRLDLRRSATTVDAEIEDHIHHVGVRVTHDGERVTAIEGKAVRLPWSPCPAAVVLLDELVGAMIGELPRVLDPRQHCTHLLDLARMAIRFAADPVEHRRVEVAVWGWNTADPRVEVRSDPEGDAPEIDLFVRRATWMAPSRGVDLDALDTLDQARITAGACYSAQPERINLARRNRGSSLPELT